MRVVGAEVNEVGATPNVMSQLAASRSRVARVRAERWMTSRGQGDLQALLATDPGWIPGMGEGALTALELQVGGEPIDLCVVGLDGGVTVVESKLASGGERRRTVVGQVIDDASAIWMAEPGVFLDRWARRTGFRLETQLGDDALALLEDNIREARINLCLAVDEIDRDLRHAVDYLNVVTKPGVRVTAMQLVAAHDGAVEILILSAFGGEIAEARVRTSTSAVGGALERGPLVGVALAV